jgi:sugar diacid utilization regulator
MRPSRHAPLADEDQGIGVFIVANHTFLSLAEEILQKARQDLPSIQLWLVDRTRLRLHRPGLRRLQRPAEIALPADESLASWPDAFDVPDRSQTGAIADLVRRFDRPAIARTLRMPQGDADDVVAILIADCRPSRPTPVLQSKLAVIATAATAAFANLKALESARTNERQLTALQEAASHLSMELDLDRVLAAICVRTRMLTKADAAYITLIDATRGDIFAKATDGIRTEAFKSARVNLGQGLGGLVARDGKPYYSCDYMKDSRFVHVVDSVVGAEGLVSVMGVPLRVGSTVIGVLYAANRTVTAFKDEDVRYMEMLAEQASIAMENARLYSQMYQSVEREKALRDSAEKHRSDLERLTRLHERLTELELARRDIDDLLKEIGAALGCRVALLDKLPEGAQVVPVAAGAEVLGWLRFDERVNSEQDPYLKQGLEQAARVVALHMLRDRAVVQAEYRVNGEFLDELLQAKATETKELIRRANYLGIDLSQPLAALYLLPAEDSDEHLDAILRATRDLAPRALLASRGGGVVMLVPGEQPQRFAKAVAAVLAKATFAFTIGIARQPSGVERLADAVAEARSAARGARAAGTSSQVVTRDDLGAHGVLLEGEAEMRLFADRLLGPLVRHDASHRTKFIQTLAVYLESGCSPTDAARRLPVHINSLYYRLDRIRDIAGYDLKNPETRFELELALRIRRATENVKS